MRKNLRPVLAFAFGAWALVAAGFAGGYVTAYVTADKPASVVVYEDGSGVLPDGRAFCISGGLCED